MMLGFVARIVIPQLARNLSALDSSGGGVLVHRVFDPGLALHTLPDAGPD